MIRIEEEVYGRRNLDDEMHPEWIKLRIREQLPVTCDHRASRHLAALYLSALLSFDVNPEAFNHDSLGNRTYNPGQFSDIVCTSSTIGLSALKLRKKR